MIHWYMEWTLYKRVHQLKLRIYIYIITSQPGHKVIYHAHVPDVYEVNRHCVKPKQIVRKQNLLESGTNWIIRSFIRKSIHEPKFNLYLTSWSYIIKKHIMLSKIMTGYQIIRPNVKLWNDKFSEFFFLVLYQCYIKMSINHINFMPISNSIKTWNKSNNSFSST